MGGSKPIRIQGFKDALELLLNSKRVTRKEWPDGFYLSIIDERLCIYRPDDKQHHPLIVREVDIEANDWVEVLT
jgi:hypothetical protein